MPSRPQQPSAGARLPLLEAARALAEGREKPTARHRLVYQIVGGPPGKRLERTLTISGNGAVSFETKDDWLAESARHVRRKMPRQQIENLFRELVDSRLFENVEAGGGFVPDSTIGIIGFDDGTRKFNYYFAADAEETRRDQERRDLNPSLQRMISVFETIVSGLLAGGGESRS
jgi:hypothetical protein